MESSGNFTVEQVELIRRLRNSGVTPQQILNAFQAFDRLDQELGELFSFPGRRNVQQDINYQPTGPVNRFTGGFLQAKQLQTNAMLGKSTKYSDANKDARESLMDFNSSCETRPTLSNSRGTSDLRTSQGTNNSTPQSVVTKNTILYNSNLASINDSPVSHKEETYSCSLDKYALFLLSLSKEIFVDLVRRCLILYPDFDPIKQAAEIGVSEMSMHVFLTGELQHVDPIMKHKLIDWFTGKLKQTDWFYEEYNHLIHFQEQTEGLDVHFTPRRERFTFREKHLEVLEMFFKKVQYPNQDEKEHIANECNNAMAIEVGRDLGEKECMTHINVSNWFSNRRKEIKRLPKKGGTKIEKVILPSRLKAKIHPTAEELLEDQLLKSKSELQASNDSGQQNGGISFNSSETDSSVSQDNLKSESTDPENPHYCIPGGHNSSTIHEYTDSTVDNSEAVTFPAHGLSPRQEKDSQTKSLKHRNICNSYSSSNDVNFIFSDCEAAKVKLEPDCEQG